MVDFFRNCRIFWCSRFVVDKASQQIWMEPTTRTAPVFHLEKFRGVNEKEGFGLNQICPPYQWPEEQQIYDIVWIVLLLIVTDEQIVTIKSESGESFLSAKKYTSLKNVHQRRCSRCWLISAKSNNQKWKWRKSAITARPCDNRWAQVQIPAKSGNQKKRIKKNPPLSKEKKKCTGLRESAHWLGNSSRVTWWHFDNRPHLTKGSGKARTCSRPRATSSFQASASSWPSLSGSLPTPPTQVIVHLIYSQTETKQKP